MTRQTIVNILVASKSD